MNSILCMLTGCRFEGKELRDISHGIMRFLRSADGTGNAICFAPWLRYIAPGFFGYTATVEENKRLMTFLKVNFPSRIILLIFTFVFSFFLETSTGPPA